MPGGDWAPGRTAHAAQAASAPLSSAGVYCNPVFHPQALSSCSPRDPHHILAFISVKGSNVLKSVAMGQFHQLLLQHGHPGESQAESTWVTCNMCLSVAGIGFLQGYLSNSPKYPLSLHKLFREPRLDILCAMVRKPRIPLYFNVTFQSDALVCSPFSLRHLRRYPHC